MLIILRVFYIINMEKLLEGMYEVFRFFHSRLNQTRSGGRFS